MERRNFMEYIVAIPFIVMLYMIFTANRNRIVAHTVQAPITQNLRLYFISDVHNRTINQRMLKRLGPVDAVIIGGDFCDRRTTLTKLEKNLQRLRQCGPIFAVWGNNDREIDEEIVRKLYQKYDVVLVENSASALTNEVYISAIEDTSSRNYSIEQALQTVPKHAFTVFISHNPIVFQRMSNDAAMLRLAGHWHGGQIRLGALGIRPKGTIQKQGEVTTIISNGYGTTLMPLRFGALPETHIITLQPRTMYNKK